MTDLPAPLTPNDCDLTDFQRMMIDIPRLRGSDFDATPSDGAWRAGLNLWLSSWHQVPAGSLSDDETTLTKAAGLGRDIKTWRKVKAEALRNWVKCDDGLLYHPVVAELALEAWLEKLAQTLSSGAGNAKRWKVDFDPAPIEADIDRTAAMLAALNPKSKALIKLERRRTRTASDPDVGGNAVGTEKLSRTPAKNVPSGSQGTGTGKGIKEERDGALVQPIEESAAPDGGRAAQRARGSRLKPDWTPSGDNRAYALSEGFTDAGVDRIAENFRDYWTAAAGQKATKLDWSAAWRTWIRNERDRRGTAGASSTGRVGWV